LTLFCELFVAASVMPSHPLSSRTSGLQRKPIPSRCSQPTRKLKLVYDRELMLGFTERSLS
jgi:hypothetical protein